MALSPSIAVIAVPYAIFILLRFDKFNEIWSELEQYETRIEIEFAEYLFERYIEPIASDTEAAMEEMMDRLGLQAFRDDFADNSENERTESPEVEENPAGDEPHLAEILGRFSDQLPTQEEVEEIMDDTMGSLFDASEYDGLRQTQEAEEADSMFVPYLVGEGLLDPSESLSRAKTFYRQYHWPNRLLFGTKVVMLLSLFALVLAGIFAILNARYMGQSLDEIAFITSMLLFAIWVILEYILWRFLRRKVIMSEETYAGKLLSPDPRDFF